MQFVRMLRAVKRNKRNRYKRSYPQIMSAMKYNLKISIWQCTFVISEFDLTLFFVDIIFVSDGGERTTTEQETLFACDILVAPTFELACHNMQCFDGDCFLFTLRRTIFRRLFCFTILPLLRTHSMCSVEPQYLRINIIRLLLSKSIAIPCVCRVIFVCSSDDTLWPIKYSEWKTVVSFVLGEEPFTEYALKRR